MKKFLQIQKNRDLARRSMAEGMTYIEIIVVLGIFAVLSGIVMFNYKDFQEKVDMKNLASDFALKFVEAQKSALSGRLPPSGAPYDAWKPSYGIYIRRGDDEGKSFIYFTDLDQDRVLDDPDECPPNFINNECLDKVSITGKYHVSEMIGCLNTVCDDLVNIGTNQGLSITFTRPDSGAYFIRSQDDGTIQDLTSNINYMAIRITPEEDNTRAIRVKVYRSGRIQIN